MFQRQGQFHLQVPPLQWHQHICTPGHLRGTWPPQRHLNQTRVGVGVRESRCVCARGSGFWARAHGHLVPGPCPLRLDWGGLGSDRPHQLPTSPSRQVNGIAFHPVHGTLATVGSDGRFSFWDKDARTKLKTSEQLDQPIAACCFNHNGNIFTYASSYDWSKVGVLHGLRRVDGGWGCFHGCLWRGGLGHRWPLCPQRSGGACLPALPSAQSALGLP